ncbi:MAG TPA: endo-1,4-beta-xylanase, partial [Saprospiraceae bacterium]|nr:endo-1,4-beta-xylanase [Saprospiraceae bacterium]
MYHLKQLITFLIILIGFTFTSCKEKESSVDEKKGLKTVFADDFLIGAAINADQIMEKDTNALSLLPTEFNSITPENIMKCEIIHPEWDKYNFDLADKIVALGDKNDMFTVGHTLVWHSQLSPFVAKIKSKDSLTMFLEYHINTIASRYDGKIEAWDVVNEALNEDG